MNGSNVRLEVIPAILTKNLEEFLHRIDRVRPYTHTIHIDIMDGKFVPNKTLSLEDIGQPPQDLNYEFHWMVEDPESEIKKIKGRHLHLVHAEAITDFDSLQKTVRYSGGKLGIAINPSTGIETISNYLNYINRVLVMAVNPGFSHQKYLPEVEAKIRELRKNPKLELEIDGGINNETIRRATISGATKFAAASAIFSHENVQYAIKNLYKAAEGIL